MVQPVVVPVVRCHGATRRRGWEKPGAGVTKRLTHWSKDAGQETGQTCTAEDIQYPGVWRLRRGTALQLEAVTPRHQGPPEELVHQKDNHRYGHQCPQQGTYILRLHSSGDIRANARQGVRLVQ